MNLRDLMICFGKLDCYPRARQKRILEKLIFELYLRKGQTPPQLIALQTRIDHAPPGIKFNPYHDELGRFTFAPGGPADDKPDGNDDTGTPLPKPSEPASGGTHLVQEEVPGGALDDALPDMPESPPTIKPPFDKLPEDPTKPPGPGYEWRGKGPPGSPQGSWYKPDTDEYLAPDMDHAPPKGPHWDYRDPTGQEWRWYPDGRMEPKNPAVVMTA